MLKSNVFKYYINMKQMRAKNEIYTVIKMGCHTYNKNEEIFSLY